MSVLLYHLVCSAKHRRVVFDETVDLVLKEVCLDIAMRYDITFLEIGTDHDHVHFLLQSVPTYSPELPPLFETKKDYSQVTVTNSNSAKSRLTVVEFARAEIGIIYKTVTARP